jgi:imidazolonepropionase-like amidohydrolase
MTRAILASMAVLLATLDCAPAPAPAAAASSDPVTAFVGVTVLPLDSAARLADQTVLVRGERIERIGPRAAVAVPAGARIIDGHGRYLMPGLMDLHVHLSRLQDLSTLLALGVTTVRNMWGAPIHLEWRDRIARGELRGPTIVTAGPIVDGDPPGHPGSLIVRTAADADRAIALHRRLGYDFIKIYNRLSPEVFDRLVAGAARGGLAVAGHVPWAVALAHAIDAGMRSVEHLTGFAAALQSTASPVAGRTDGPSRARQVDYIDEARIAPLARQLAAHHAFAVPTLSVMDQLRSEAEVRAMLAQPEMRWLPPWERALAEPGPDDPEDLDRNRRRLALNDRVVRALDEAGAPVAAGTDPGNPLVIPGFSLHRELALLVHAGLSPLAALQAATRRGAELLGRQDQLGGIAAGMRADLLLLDADPLDDIHNTRRIAGVMARGRYLARAELDAMLAQVAAEFAGPQDPFRGAPALRVEGEAVFRADYDITWADVPFGAERVVVGRRGDELTAAIESIDLHQGETTRVRWQAGGAHDGGSLALDLDGPVGRGHLEVRRDAAELHARGSALPGIEVALDHAIAPGTLLAPGAVLSGVVLWRSRLQALAVGQSIEVREQDVELGSEVDVHERVVQVRHTGDRPWHDGGASIPARSYEITTAHGHPSELVVDAEGWPLELVSQDHGATLRLRRRPARR